MSDEYRAQHVWEALAHDPRVCELGISVKVGAATIDLSGEVATEARRDAAAIVAGEVLSGYEVRNHLTVVARSQPDGVENLP